MGTRTFCSEKYEKYVCLIKNNIAVLFNQIIENYLTFLLRYLFIFPSDHIILSAHPGLITFNLGKPCILS